MTESYVLENPDGKLFIDDGSSFVTNTFDGYPGWTRYDWAICLLLLSTCCTDELDMIFSCYMHSILLEKYCSKSNFTLYLRCSLLISANTFEGTFFYFISFRKMLKILSPKDSFNNSGVKTTFWGVFEVFLFLDFYFSLSFSCILFSFILRDDFKAFSFETMFKTFEFGFCFYFLLVDRFWGWGGKDMFWFKAFLWMGNYEYVFGSES